jgi:hypothetical protein
MNSERLRKKVDRVQDCALRMLRSREAESMCIGRGDYGGQLYFTIPVSLISCTPSQLSQLVFEIDFIHWRDPVGVDLLFGRPETEPGLADGGMGGGLITNRLWVHEVMEGSLFALRIKGVLAASSASVWPGGATELGEPLNVSDVVEMLEAETGEAPIFDLLQTAARLCRTSKFESSSERLSIVLERFLCAKEPRNRIQAANCLEGKVSPGRLVNAVKEAASGTVAFPKWGQWQIRATYVLGLAARAHDRVALAALNEFSVKDAWIAECGPYVFASPCWTKVQDMYFDPDTFRRELTALTPSSRRNTPSS